MFPRSCAVANGKWKVKLRGGGSSVADVPARSIGEVVAGHPALNELFRDMLLDDRVGFERGVNRVIDAYTIIVDPDDPPGALEVLKRIKVKRDLLRAFQLKLLPRGEVVRDAGGRTGVFYGRGADSGLTIPVRLDDDGEVVEILHPSVDDTGNTPNNPGSTVTGLPAAPPAGPPKLRLLGGAENGGTGRSATRAVIPPRRYRQHLPDDRPSDDSLREACRVGRGAEHAAAHLPLDGPDLAKGERQLARLLRDILDYGSTVELRRQNAQEQQWALDVGGKPLYFILTIDEAGNVTGLRPDDLSEYAFDHDFESGEALIVFPDRRGQRDDGPAARHQPAGGQACGRDSSTERGVGLRLGFDKDGNVRGATTPPCSTGR